MSAEPATVFAGQRRAYDAVCALVGGFTEHADALKAWRVRPPAGLLLYGPPGTGKTHVVRAAAAAFGLPLLVLQGSGGGGGADELCARLRTTFARAEAEAEAATIARGQATPALLFMDELDTLCPKRSDAGSSDDDRRAVAQLLTLLDGVTPRQRVIAVAATNRAHGIDGAPRFDPGPRALRPCPSLQHTTRVPHVLSTPGRGPAPPRASGVGGAARAADVRGAAAGVAGMLLANGLGPRRGPRGGSRGVQRLRRRGPARPRARSGDAGRTPRRSRLRPTWRGGPSLRGGP